MSATQESLSVDRWQEKIAEVFEPKEPLLIPILQFIQQEVGYLPREAMAATARFLRVSQSKVFGVASFYAQFHFEPRGRNTITICRGTACHVRGSGKILRDVEAYLGVKAGQTTEDLQFSVETVACFGSCALAPVVVVNEKVRGRQTSATVKAAIDEIRAAEAVATSGGSEEAHAGEAHPS